MDILPQLIVNGLITGSIYAIASAGLALSYGLQRVLNFAHGHLMMLGAYLFYLATVEWGCGLVLGAVSTTVLMVLFALVSYALFVRPFARSSTFLPLVSTLALGTVLESAVAMVFGVNVKSLSVGSFESYELYGVFITPIQIVILASALVTMIALAILVHCTRIGRQLRAVAEHGPSAESLGVNREWIGVAGFVVAALLAAFAGILIGYETNLQPTMGGAYTIKAFAAMVLGGLGSTWGALLGSFLLGMIENLSIGLDFGAWSLPAGYKDAFAYACILFVLLVRPQGIWGRTSRGGY